MQTKLTLRLEEELIRKAKTHPIAIHLDLEDMVVRQTVLGGEVLPPEPRHVGDAGRGSGRGPSREHEQHCKAPSHNVFRYSIRSFNSSLDRSFVTPCVSWGLKTVQISSNVRADPSCK